MNQENSTGSAPGLGGQGSARSEPGLGGEHAPTLEQKISKIVAVIQAINRATQDIRDRVPDEALARAEDYQTLKIHLNELHRLAHFSLFSEAMTDEVISLMSEQLGATSVHLLFGEHAYRGAIVEPSLLEIILEMQILITEISQTFPSPEQQPVFLDTWLSHHSGRLVTYRDSLMRKGNVFKLEYDLMEKLLTARQHARISGDGPVTIIHALDIRHSEQPADELNLCHDVVRYLAENWVVLSNAHVLYTLIQHIIQLQAYVPTPDQLSRLATSLQPIKQDETAFARFTDELEYIRDSGHAIQYTSGSITERQVKNILGRTLRMLRGEENLTDKIRKLLG